MFFHLILFKFYSAQVLQQQHMLCDLQTSNCQCHSVELVYYIIQHAVSGYGDPHFTTFENRRLIFQERGDFTVMEALALKEGVIRPVFTLQGRFYELSCNGCSGATVHQGLAFGHSDLAFQVSKSLLLTMIIH